MRCPECFSTGDSLRVYHDQLMCHACSAKYDFEGSVPVMLSPENSPDLLQHYKANKQQDWLSLDGDSIGFHFSRRCIKTRFKRLNKILNFIKFFHYAHTVCITGRKPKQ